MQADQMYSQSVYFNLKNCWPLAHFRGVTRKPVFGVSDQSDRPVCAATEARLSLKILDKETREMKRASF